MFGKNENISLKNAISFLEGRVFFKIGQFFENDEQFF
jgi:hypothetical protein